MYKLQASLTITGHSRLSGHSSRDQDNLCASESCLETGGIRSVASDLALGVNVADIGRDTFRTSAAEFE